MKMSVLSQINRVGKLTRTCYGNIRNIWNNNTLTYLLYETTYIQEYTIRELLIRL